MERYFCAVAIITATAEFLAVRYSTILSQEHSIPTSANMTTTRYLHTATLLNDGRVLVTGGYSGGIDPGVLMSAELFNPNSGTFTDTLEMSVEREQHTATMLSDGTVLVAGGDNDLYPSLDSAELFQTPPIYNPIAVPLIPGPWRHQHLSIRQQPF